MNIYKYVLLIVLTTMFVFPSVGQEKVTLKVASETDLSFNGTSNVHDWSCQVKEVNGQGSFLKSLLKGGEEPMHPVQGVRLTIPVKSIKSGKNKMNKIMYDALKAEKHPTIEYELTQSEILDASDGHFTLKTKGLLTIAGVTRQVSLRAKGKRVDDNTLAFSGNKTLKMSDYNIDPPKALFGAIKSGDEVNVQFNAQFK